MKCKLFSFLMMVGVVGSLSADRTATPTIVNRSQGRNAAWKVAGLSDKVHLYDAGHYINADVTLAYEQSFRGDKLAECLFGSDATSCKTGTVIKVQGSEVANKLDCSWLADYFYLPPDYDASFCINPKTQTGLANLDLYIALNELPCCLDGMYLRVHGPVTWTTWDLDFYEQCDQNFTSSYRQGYFDPAGMSSDQLLNTFGEYASGQAPLALAGTTRLSDPVDPNSTRITVDNGVTFEGLKYAKMERCSRSRTGFADLRFELGWNVIQCDDYHFGFNVQVAAPTGSRRDPEFVFDPTIGNGNHWEVGGGLTGHYACWRSKAEDKSVGVYFDASFTHINNGRERRTFDLCNKPNSRYMLAEKMGTPVNYLRAGETTASATTVVPSKQFQGIFTPVANLTTIDVNVRSAVQADIAIMLNMSSNNWNFDVGYDFWARSCEKIDLPNRKSKDCCPSLCSDPKDTWALKGDAAVYGFMSADSGFLTTDTPIMLSATQSQATIHNGANALGLGEDCPDTIEQSLLENCGVDNPKIAFARSTGSPDQYLTHTPGQLAETDAINTSCDPLFINCCDLNLQRTKGISHKLFVNVNHTWECDGWTPYLGVGGSAEFAGTSSNDDCCEQATVCSDGSCATDSCQPNCCTDCLKCSISQWSVWLKGGVNFN